MSPSAVRVSADTFNDDLDLSITGVGVQYPPYHNGPDAIETLAKRFYPESNAMKKVLSINRFTGIEARASIGEPDHPIVNREKPPSIKELNDLFMEDGVKMSTSACQQAIDDAGLSASDVTHMVSTTCTNSANPGYDHFVAKNLGLSSSLEKVLLHGIGCSGGMAAMRTACNLALGARAIGRPARVLVCACEISSTLVRSELESIDKNQEVRIGICLFSDCASACIVSNGINEDEERGAVFDVLGWQHKLLDDSASDLGFDVDPLGWKVVLTSRVPSLTSTALAPAFKSLCDSCPAISSISAPDFDWALHPGGATILTGAQSALNLTEEHLRCSYEIYVEHGNSSSATILSVLNKERKRGAEAKKDVVAAAFGPGITLEIMLLRRGARGAKPANTNGHASTNGVNGTTNGHNGTNGYHNGETNGTEVEINGDHSDQHLNGHVNGANGLNDALADGASRNANGLEAIEIGNVSLPTEQLD